MTTKTPREVINVALYDVGALHDDCNADWILSALTAAGFVIVPREPTEKMIGAAAYEGRYVTFAKTYRAMLDAAEEKPT